MFFAELEVPFIEIFIILSSLIDNLTFAMIFTIFKLPHIYNYLSVYFLLHHETIYLKVALIMISLSKFNPYISIFHASSPKAYC